MAKRTTKTRKTGPSSSLRKTRTQSSKGVTTSTSTGNKSSGRRTTVSTNHRTGKISIFETFRTMNGGWKRKKRN